MPRVLPFSIVCVLAFFTFATAQETVEEPKHEYIETLLPVYGSAVPFLPPEHELSGKKTVSRGGSTTTWTIPSPRLSYWNKNDLKDIRLLLPLGEGESIHDKLYSFKADWETDPALPFFVQDYAFDDHAFISEAHDKTFSPEQRFRTIEILNTGMLQLKFDFKPVKFNVPAKIDWTNRNEVTAEKPEFLEAIPILTAKLKVRINGKNDGFVVSFSKDGEYWHTVRRTQKQHPTWPEHDTFAGFPCETLFVRIKIDDEKSIERVSVDFEAILKTSGFIGHGMTEFGRVSKDHGSHKRPIEIPFAFLAPDKNLYAFFDNRGDEPYKIGGWLAHNYSDRERFGQGMGGHNADGGHSGPTVPPKSIGVYACGANPGYPGEHMYVFHCAGISFIYEFLDKPHPSFEPYPSIQFMNRLLERAEEREK